MGKSKRVALVLMGLPLSKNRLALQKLLKNDKNTFEIICTEDIKRRLDSTNPTKVKWDDVQSVIEERLEAAYINSKYIVIDHPNCKSSERKLFCRLLLHYGFEDVRGVFFNNTLEDAITEQSVNNGIYSEKDLRVMQSNLNKSPPCEEEGFEWHAKVHS